MRSSSTGADAFAFEQLGGIPAQPAPGALGAPADAGIDLATLEAELSAARAEGYEAGLAEARRELEPAASALAQAIQEARRERAGGADALEREAVDLALQVAEKVVEGAVEVNPDTVLDVVRGALRRLVERQAVTVLVNPDDLERVREAADSIQVSLGGIEKMEIQAERRVGRGGAIVRTLDGEVDARIVSQLERVREIVESELTG